MKDQLRAEVLFFFASRWERKCRQPVCAWLEKPLHFVVNLILEQNRTSWGKLRNCWQRKARPYFLACTWCLLLTSCHWMLSKTAKNIFVLTAPHFITLLGYCASFWLVSFHCRSLVVNSKAIKHIQWQVPPLGNITTWGNWLIRLLQQDKLLLHKCVRDYWSTWLILSFLSTAVLFSSKALTRVYPHGNTL